MVFVVNQLNVFKSMFLKSIQDPLWNRLGARKGEMIDMINNGNGQVRLDF